MTSGVHGGAFTQHEAPHSSMLAMSAMSSHDPRSSSTQSLAPDPAVDRSNLRRVLLVYIHGFMGNETSFRSFPAHVHNLVTVTLADTRVVHTKLYPRYKSRNTLENARDNFSNWHVDVDSLPNHSPHEDQWTDVILLGHSMGGLLAADVALAFRHRIVGLVNFDVPFLGMHPGIIKAGLGSLFHPPPTPVDQVLEQEPKKPTKVSTFFNPKPNDPNFNPAFENDVRLPVRKGWENTLHWLNKHYADGLRQATKGLVKSHFEFGGAMADYKALKDRYARVRALEEDDEQTRKSANPEVASPPRVRFVNYYTVSTGRPKKPKSPKSHSPSRLSSRLSQFLDRENTPAVRSQSRVNSPRVSVQVQEYQKAVKARNKAINERTKAEEKLEKQQGQKRKEEGEGDEDQNSHQHREEERLKQEAERMAEEAPEMQALDEDVGAMHLGDDDDDDDNDDHGGDASSSHAYGKYDFSRSAIMNQATPDEQSSMHESNHRLATTDGKTSRQAPCGEQAEKKKKLGKFCMLPPKDSAGNVDPTWVRVLMKDMDEVSAHTSLFFVNETYERLVGDVGGRVEEWIREADSVRVVREMSGMS
ncbi:hypothetical protein ACEQ8H_005672 [Pleosporales sp. CAS-2024a]